MQRKFFFLLFLLLTPISIVAGENAEIYLIVSSSAYDEAIIPKIGNAFKNNGFLVNLRYLNQRKTSLDYVNSDTQRSQTLIMALLDPKVIYLWFIRGGGGAINLYPDLMDNARIIKSKPKVLISFSNVTGIAHFVEKELGWLFVHAVLAANNKEVSGSVAKTNVYSSLKDVMLTIRHVFSYWGLQPQFSVRRLTIHGKASGGNLSVFLSLLPTRHGRPFNEDIVFFQDVAITPHQLDRMLHQLLFMPSFKPRALVLGRFFLYNAGRNSEKVRGQILHNFSNKASYPVFLFPYFYQGEVNQALLLG